MELLRKLLGQVVSLAPVLFGVIEFPHVVIEGRRLLADEEPWRFVPRYSCPTLVVDTSVAKHLEVLGLVTLCCLGVIERVEHAHALNGVLLHTVHKFRLWNSGSFENCRRHIDAMAKLPTHLAFGFNPLWPVNNGPIAGSTPV